MQYTRIGHSGLIVSRLAFGAMTFGSDPSVPAIYKVDRQNAEAMVAKALEAGINFFDTADGYAGGQSEVILGELLGGRRQEVVIATKVGFRTGEPITQAGLSRRHILSSCEGSLKRLNTDYIDLYIAHKEDPFTPLEETLEALNDLVRMGRVKYLGFSNWSAWKAATALQMQKARRWAQFTSGQMNYSLVGRGASVAQIALAWLLAKPVVSSVIIGASKLSQIEDNLRAVDVKLTGAEIAELDEITAPTPMYPNWFNTNLVDKQHKAALAET